MVRAIGGKRVGVLAVAAVIFALSGVVMAQAKAGAALVDKRDGKTYRTVVIGEQTWMAENLNYNANGSKCYDNSAANCEKYGRLYDWTTAKGACPAGWHLPGDAEWTKLENAVGGINIAGKKLKSKTDWKWDSNTDKSGNGTDEHGFSALPGGYGHSDGNFYDAGDDGHWWSATEYGASSAWYRYMDYSIESVSRNYYGKTTLLSVRCVQD